MKTIKNLLALVLALAMVLCLFACGNDENGTTEPDTSTTTQSQETKPQATEPDNTEDPDNVEYVYTVTVKDDAGNPISGVAVQICAGDSCVPKVTDANGIAGYETEITGDDVRTAKLIAVPEGYTAEVMEITMDGVDNVEFILKAEAGEVEYVYTVQVITVEDYAVEGVWVQICAGSTCVPKQTDANGMAGYEDEITGDGELTAKLISIPEGYELAEGEETEIVLEDGLTDVIFVLRELLPENTGGD